MRDMARYEISYGKMRIVVTAAVVEKIDVLINCGLPCVNLKSA